MEEKEALDTIKQVLVMPHDGVQSVVELIEAAQSSLDIKMFSFDCPVLLAATLDAHRRGVAVRVMLNPKRSSGSRANDATEAALRGAGVAVRWSSGHFAVTHEKSMLIDGHTLLLATFNFVGKYFTRTRDYGLLIEDRRVIALVRACFEADWTDNVFAPATDDTGPVLLSNFNSRLAMGRFIDGAKHRLLVQHPKYSDLAILDRLLAARDRGVTIHLLCGGKHGISPSDMMDTFSALRSLRRAGVHVRNQHGLRLHAKLLLADGKRALVGSMNIDRSAFDLRRELGVVFDDEHAVHKLIKQFDGDWHEAHKYEPPDPFDLHLETGVDAMGSDDPDLAHE